MTMKLVNLRGRPVSTARVRASGLSQWGEYPVKGLRLWTENRQLGSRLI